MLVRLRRRVTTPPSHARQVCKHLEEAALPTQEQHSEHSCVSLQRAQEMEGFSPSPKTNATWETSSSPEIPVTEVLQ